MTAAISKPQRAVPPTALLLHCCFISPLSIVLHPVSPHLRGLFITRRNMSLLPSRPSVAWSNKFISPGDRARPVHVVTVDNPNTHTHTHTPMTPGDRRLNAARFLLEAARDGRPRAWWRDEEEEDDSIEEWVRREGRCREGSQEVCKDSSALSHHYKRPRLYRRIPP